MRATAACRFIAAERLKDRDRRSALTIAIASALVLSFTLYPYLFHPSIKAQAELTALSFLASLLTIAFSLIQYSTNDAANSEQFHRCGLEVNELFRLNEGREAALSDLEVRQLDKDYNTILQKYSVNHEYIDIETFRASRPDLYTLGRIRLFRIWITRLSMALFPYLLVASIPVGFAFILALDKPDNGVKQRLEKPLPLQSHRQPHVAQHRRAHRNSK